jgi:hypothetical protein
MSTKISIRAGGGYHLYHEIFDADHVFLDLEGVEFRAENGAGCGGSRITVAIPRFFAEALHLVTPGDRPPPLNLDRLDESVPAPAPPGNPDPHREDDESQVRCALSDRLGAFVHVEEGGTLVGAWGSIHDGIRFVWLSSPPPNLKLGARICDTVVDELVAAGRLAPYRSVFADRPLPDVSSAALAAGFAVERRWAAGQIDKLVSGNCAPADALAILLGTTRPADALKLALVAALVEAATGRDCRLDRLLSAWPGGENNGPAMSPLDRPPTHEPDPVIEPGLADRPPDEAKAWLRRHLRQQVDHFLDALAGKNGMTTADLEALLRDGAGDE